MMDKSSAHPLLVVDDVHHSQEDAHATIAQSVRDDGR